MKGIAWVVAGVAVLAVGFLALKKFGASASGGPSVTYNTAPGQPPAPAPKPETNVYDVGVALAETIGVLGEAGVFDDDGQQDDPEEETAAKAEASTSKV